MKDDYRSVYATEERAQVPLPNGRMSRYRRDRQRREDRKSFARAGASGWAEEMSSQNRRAARRDPGQVTSIRRLGRSRADKPCAFDAIRFLTFYQGLVETILDDDTGSYYEVKERMSYDNDNLPLHVIRSPANET